MKKTSLIKTSLIIISTISGFLATEIGMRHLLQDRLSLPIDEQNNTCRYDSELGWFPKENSQGKLYRSRCIDVQHNSRGFRDSEHIVSNKPRIMFLGDSFVWGFDVEKNERFTEKLRLRIPEWSIYNLGVIGYGTDQELILLAKHYKYYRPDIVFVLFCTENDDYDNTHNIVYGGYHKPYFEIEQNILLLSGTPVPKSFNHYISRKDLLSKLYWFRLIAKAYYMLTSPPSLELDNVTPSLILKIEELVKSQGAQLIVGSTGSHPDLSNFLSSRNIAYVDLSNPHRYQEYGFHWTPDGHTFVSERIYDFLNQEGYLRTQTSGREPLLSEGIQ